MSKEFFEKIISLACLVEEKAGVYILQMEQILFSNNFQIWQKMGKLTKKMEKLTKNRKI